MFNFLGCFFVLILGILFIGIAFLGSLIDAVFSFLGLKKRVNRDSNNAFNQQQGNYNHQNSQQSRHGQDQQTAGQQTRKIFEKDDSEYVDFEEL